MKAKVKKAPKAEKPKVEKEKSVGAFDYINSILRSKQNLMRDTDNDELAEKGYVPFLTNKALSFHVDAVLYANEMNRRHGIDGRLQYEYYLGSIRAMNRKYTWLKKSDSEAVEVVQRAYGVNPTRAEEIIAIIGPDGVEAARKRLETGGLVK